MLISYNKLGDNMKNRDMFYQNTQASMMNPGMFIPPSGYNLNQEYQAYGPNVIPNQNNDYEQRINKLEKQVKNLDIRLQKLESTTETNDNFYMI